MTYTAEQDTAKAGTAAAKAHVSALVRALDAFEAKDLGRLRTWAETLAQVLPAGGRLLAVGNGGSAAQSQHLTSEFVGRYLRDRQPYSAISLHAESSAVTAIVNDYGAHEVFARQVRAHGREGDVLIAMSTSGASPNVLAAVEAAREIGMITWAFTGKAPNPLSSIVDDAVTVEAATPTVQEIHQIALHVLCEGFDEIVLDEAQEEVVVLP